MWPLSRMGALPIASRSRCGMPGFTSPNRCGCRLHRPSGKGGQRGSVQKKRHLTSAALGLLIAWETGSGDLRGCWGVL